VTPDRWALSGPLGRRLLVAFVLVALSSVAVLTVAALVGTDRGLASAHRAERQRVADRVAAEAGRAFARGGGWEDADLRAARAVADAAGADLVVRDATGSMIFPGPGRRPGMGGMHAGSTGDVAAPVVVDGRQVGGVRLTFATSVAEGRSVAWSWILGAGAVALLVALVVSGFVVRRLTRPLVALTAAARRLAAGDRSARARVDAPGELGEVARAFDTMADEVVRAETVRRRLSADVAHELRTPLAALQAGLEELRDGLRRPDTARLTALHDQSLRLGRVVQDLADLSAAESAALSLRPVDADLTDIVRAALDAQRPRFDAVGLNVDVELATGAPVRVDPDRIHQALVNVFANAVRYCRPGDWVTVGVHVVGGTVELTVTDTGPGIPSDELPRVFDRLWRGRGTTAVAGTGIGLAVVRELVTAHGGTVAASSPPGGGTTITVRLPLAPRSDPGRSETPGGTADNREDRLRRHVDERPR
jgi:two-component system sensor histidine kinase BaeS